LGNVGSFAESSFDLIVVAVANQDERISLLGKLDGLDVYLGDQRASSVNDPEAAALAAFSNGGRDAMGGVDDTLAVGDVVYFMNENCALSLTT